MQAARGRRLAARDEDVCLRNTIPIGLAAWTKSLVVRGLDAQQGLCFQSMDAANCRLQDTFDPFLARLYRLTQATEASVDFLMVSFQQDAGKCEDVYGSAYVVTIMQEPVDYFMQCMHTFDCRAKCLDTHSAFELALAEVANPPSFEHATAATARCHEAANGDIGVAQHVTQDIGSALINEGGDETSMDGGCGHLEGNENGHKTEHKAADTDSAESKCKDNHASHENGAETRMRAEIGTDEQSDASRSQAPQGAGDETGMAWWAEMAPISAVIQVTHDCISQLQSRLSPHYTPRSLLDTLPRIADEFHTGQQVDAHEFLVCLLGKMDQGGLREFFC